jgi:hypothetical protein
MSTVTPLRRRVRGPTEKMDAAGDLLLSDIPSRILGSYPVWKWGLSQGLAFSAGRWRAALAAGALTEVDMRASIIPVAQLTSAMLEALLRGVPIDLRDAAFEALCDEGDRVLSGRPHAVILQSGIE